MRYITAAETAEKWKLSERSVRNYCAEGRVIGAIREGKNWLIPETAGKPERKQGCRKIPVNLLPRLILEKETGMPGGIYHRVQIELTYNSNHIEGSCLTHDQTRAIFETRTLLPMEEHINVDDIIETANHFRCIDLIIDQANRIPSESMIRQLHLILKSGTNDSRQPWFAVGGYKKLENEVGGMETTAPADVSAAMKDLLRSYNSTKQKSFEEIIAFHYAFERIHPFQDGNGRIGRLILFKECLRNRITPFIITDDLKEYYYRGLREWKNTRGYLLDTCLTAQDRFKRTLDQFGIIYSD